MSNTRRENAIIVTGDPEFKNVEHIVEIEWLDKFRTVRIEDHPATPLKRGLRPQHRRTSPLRSDKLAGNLPGKVFCLF